MTNLRVIEADQDNEGLGSSWRSFGSIASSLAAQAEARMGERTEVEEIGFVPVAWAAE